MKTILAVMAIIIGLTVAAEARHDYLSHPTGRTCSDGSFQMTVLHSER